MEIILLLLAIALALLIGLWGIASLIGGAVKSGGLLNLIKNWIKSIASED